jgi:hypothetical protein
VFANGLDAENMARGRGGEIMVFVRCGGEKKLVQKSG